LPSVTT